MSVKDTPPEEKSVDERARDHEWYKPRLSDHVRQYLDELGVYREGMYLIEIEGESVEVEETSGQINTDAEAWSGLMERATRSEEQPNDGRNVRYYEWGAPGIEDHIFGTTTHATYVRLPDTNIWVPALRTLLLLASETYYVGRSSTGVASTVDDHLRGVGGRSMLRNMEPVRFVAGLESGIPQDEKNVGRDLTEGVFAEDGSLLSPETICARGQLVFSPG